MALLIESAVKGTIERSVANSGDKGGIVLPYLSPGSAAFGPHPWGKLTALFSEGRSVVQLRDP